MVDIRAAMKQAFKERIVSGLTRHAVTKPSKWAEKYRVIDYKPWSFKRHPWLIDMHDSKSEYNVGQKAAQMGFTETLLNLAFYAIDILGKDVLYVLPNKNPDASDFSSGRFDPAREQSQHIADMFTNVDNVGHKRAGNANLYVRGSNSRAGLKSVPIHTLLMDEVAEFVEENIPLALERTSGQLSFLVWMVSTPTIDGFGISKFYEQSDKKHLYFKCPSCSRYIKLLFPESLVICGDDKFDPRVKESHLICVQCKAKLDHQLKSEWLSTYKWVPEVENRDWSGWSVSQLYSTTVKPEAIAASYFDSLVHPAHEVELYNSKLGLSHTIKGARVDSDEIEYAIMHGPKRRRNDAPLGGLYTMGVDVGKFLHFTIRRWIKDPKGVGSYDLNQMFKPVVENYGTVSNFSELDKYFAQYNLSMCVVDMNPEKRAALEFARRHYGRVKLCFFGRGISARSVILGKDPDEPVISVDRSAWLDQTLGRFKNKTISLPIDVNLEYRAHIQAPVKTYTKDADGNYVSKYLTQDSQEDHYTFAELYAEVALAFSGVGGATQNIVSY